MPGNTAPLRMQRNGDYHQTWTIRDTGATSEEHPLGQPVDLTNYTFAMKIKAVAGASAVVLTVPQTPDPLETGIYIEDPPASGQITVTVKAEDMEAANLDNEQGVVVLAYDVLWTDADDITECIARGPFHYEPGVT